MQCLISIRKCIELHRILIVSLFPILFTSLNAHAVNDDTSAKSHLSVLNNTIVDSSGNAIVLRGFGLGGWLMPEGYMLGFPKPHDSPGTIRSAVIDMTDESTATEFFLRYEENYVTEDDIAAIKSWGFNSLRLPFNADRIMPRKNQSKTTPYNYDQTGLALIDKLVNWATKHHLYVILDMHAAPGGQSKHNIADSGGIARLWEEPDVYWPQTIALWKMLADRYKSNPWVVGYDVLNEPMLPGTEELGGEKQDLHNNRPLRELYIEISKAIREVDQGTKILFLEGGFWGQNMKDLLPSWDQNTAYSYHAYPAPTSLDGIQSSVKNVIAEGHPVWLGEWGENWNNLDWQDWLIFNKKVTTLMEKELVGWSWWTTKKFGKVTQPWHCHYPEGFSVIQNYLLDRGPKPTKGFAKEVLLTMVDNLKSEKCSFVPSLVGSLGGDVSKKNLHK